MGESILNSEILEVSTQRSWHQLTSCIGIDLLSHVQHTRCPYVFPFIGEPMVSFSTWCGALDSIKIHMWHSQILSYTHRNGQHTLPSSKNVVDLFLISSKLILKMIHVRTKGYDLSLPKLQSTESGAYGWMFLKPIISMKYRSSPLTMALGMDNQ